MCLPRRPEEMSTFLLHFPCNLQGTMLFARLCAHFEHDDCPALHRSGASEVRAAPAIDYRDVSRAFECSGRRMPAEEKGRLIGSL